jgi:hypothetical protein
MKMAVPFHRIGGAERIDIHISELRHQYTIIFKVAITLG